MPPRVIPAFVLAVIVSAPGTVDGDTEGTPQTYVQSSTTDGTAYRGDRYAKCVPADRRGSKPRTLVYEVSSEADVLEDVYDWYSGEVYLAGTSKGTLVARVSSSFRGHEPKQEDLALGFYCRGKLLKAYSAPDLTKGQQSVQASVSHYQWCRRVTGLLLAHRPGGQFDEVRLRVGNDGRAAAVLRRLDGPVAGGVGDCEVRRLAFRPPHRRRVSHTVSARPGPRHAVPRPAAAALPYSPSAGRGPALEAPAGGGAEVVPAPRAAAGGCAAGASGPHVDHGGEDDGEPERDPNQPRGVVGEVDPEPPQGSVARGGVGGPVRRDAPQFRTLDEVGGADPAVDGQRPPVARDVLSEVPPVEAPHPDNGR